MAKIKTSAYAELYKLLYIDIAECYDFGHALVDELNELSLLIRTEGIGFLTKTLPLYGRAFDKALSGTVKFDCVGCKTDADGFPLFGKLLNEVFDRFPCEGKDVELRLKPQPSVKAIRHLRQLYYYMYKLELDHDEEATKSVIDTFVKVDSELPSLEELTPLGKKILDTASVFACRVFGTLDHTCIIPRHGPGSVATGERDERKLSFSRLYTELDSEYPFTGYFMSGINHIADEPHYVDALQVASSGHARVVLVPKDSRGPRLISMEPLEYQWIQQGLMRLITSRLESHPLTRGHVNFTHQSINRDLALRSSADSSYSTLDMKEASDRVSLALVKRVFEHCPCLAGFLAARTSHTTLPDGTLVQLRKFAPMGSAICFPIESFVFYALCVSVLVNVCGYSLKRARRAVYVYGDDLIVEQGTASALFQHLPEFGLAFNLGKCCVQGSFRESCGCDAFDGVDITPIRLRKPLEHLASKRQLCAVTITSTVMHSNRLHGSGHYRAAEYLRKVVEDLLGPLPLANSDDSLAGVLSFVRPEVPSKEYNKSLFRTRMHPKFQTYQLRSWRVSVPKERKPTDSWRSILKWFSQPSSETPTDTYANPSRIQLKKGWADYVM